MRRVTALWAMLFLCMGTVVCSAENPAADFRNVRWGMSEAEVQGSEANPAEYQDEENMAYRTTVAGFDCKLLYFFRDGKLIGAGCAFLHSHSNETEFVRDYDRLREELTGTYGKPVRSEVKWKKDRYKNHPEQWGQAIIANELELSTVWQTERTMVGLGLMGDDGEHRFTLVYYSREDYKAGGLRREEETAEEEEDGASINAQ